MQATTLQATPTPADIVAQVQQRIAAVTRAGADQAERRWAYAELAALAAR